MVKKERKDREKVKKKSKNVRKLKKKELEKK